MSTTIDELDIQIKSSSNKAIKSIDKLSVSLLSLKKNSDVSGVTSNLNKLNSSLNNLSKTSANRGISKLNYSLKNVTDGVSKTNSGLGGLFTSFNLKMAGIVAIAKKSYDVVGGWVNNINAYVENVNLFTVSMGKFSDEAKVYAELVQDRMGIDSSEWMRAQGVFMSMANGFGLAKDQAYQLSKGMTEVSYDLSSFFNISTEEAFLKVRSGIAGELEPLRALGFALSQASLQEIARQKGIDKSVASMTEAEKAQLRYTAIVEQAMNMGAIGDFAKTLSSPANAMRILGQQFTQMARALGSVFIPMITAVIPYVQAFVKVLTNGIKVLATLVGFKMPEWTNKDWDGSSGIVETTEALDDATASAKKLKSVSMGFDELNVINPNSGNAGSKGLSGGSPINMDLQSVWDRGLIESIDSQVDMLVKKFENFFDTFLNGSEILKKVIPIIGSLLIGFGAYKLVSNFSGSLKLLSLVTKPLIKLITAVTIQFGASGGGLTGVLGVLKLLVSSCASAFSGFLSVIAPAVGIIAAVGSVIYVLWTNFDKVILVVKEFIKKIDLEGKFNAIKEQLQPLLSKLGGLHDLFTFIGTVILTLLQPAIAIVMGAFTGLMNALSPLIQAVGGVIDIFSALGMFLVGIFTLDAQKTSDAIKLMKDGIVNVFSGLWGAVSGFVSGFVNGTLSWFMSLGKAVPEQVSIMISKVGNFFGGLWDSAKSGVSSCINNVVSWFSSLPDKIYNSIRSIPDKITNAFDGIKTGVSRVIGNTLNSGIDMINRFIEWVNSKMKFSWNGLKIMGKEIFPSGNVTLFTIPQITQRFDGGGFIEDGLFTMNRGEIAGKFNNGKSVVANNQQIIEGISSGVYAAFVKAMRERGSSDNSFHIYLDGKTIRANIKKSESESGVNIFGNELGYGF